MVVVAILGILAALAAPSFTPLIERLRVRQAAEDFSSGLALARSEAMRRGGGVAMRRTEPNATDCPDVEASDASQWGCGWFVFLDTNGDGVHDSGEEIVRTGPPPRGVKIDRAGAVAFMSLNRWGDTEPRTHEFIVRPSRSGSTESTAVCIGAGGRTAIRTGATSC